MLCYSEVLLAKLPDQFSVHFRREGVLHQVPLTTNFFAFIDNGEYFLGTWQQGRT
jgi:hypothetical protein